VGLKVDDPVYETAKSTPANKTPDHPLPPPKQLFFCSRISAWLKDPLPQSKACKNRASPHVSRNFAARHFLR